jgi:hypothetical protein
MKKKIFVFLLIILLLISCGGVNPPPSFKEVRKILDTIFPEPSQGCSPPTQSKDINVYIDGSVSCQGFATGGSKYIKFLKAIRQWAQSGSTLRFLKFGNLAEPANTSLEAALTRDFYDQSQTRLVELIESFVKLDSSKLPGTFLIITDGCQSHAQRDIINLIRPTLRLIERGYYFQILGIRSEFDGNVYSEILGGVKIGRFNSNKYEDGERPFYCFIFSTQKDFAAKNLLVRIPGDFDFHLLDFSELPKILFTNFKEEERKSPTLRIYEKKKEGAVLIWKGDSPAKGNLTALLELDTTLFPIGTGSLTAEILSSGGDLTNCQLCSARLSSGNNNKIQCLFSLSEGERKGWSYYKIKLYPTANTFSPPRWVEKWSTDTDTSLKYFNKTLFLKEFISEVINNILSRTPLFVIYIGVGR